MILLQKKHELTVITSPLSNSLPYLFNIKKNKTQGNRFHGDLLLREDQLLVGAWNQTRKKVSGNKEAESIFGNDIASYVGCHKSMSNGDDLRVGFGRKNPNATKFGRERRGKKKKSADKACGLRRYAN